MHFNKNVRYLILKQLQLKPYSLFKKCKFIKPWGQLDNITPTQSTRAYNKGTHTALKLEYSFYCLHFRTTTTFSNMNLKFYKDFSIYFNTFVSITCLHKHLKCYN